MILALTLRVGYQEAVAIKTALRLAYLMGAGSDPRATSRQKAAYCNWSMSLGSGKKGMSNSAMIDQKGRLKIPATLVPELKGSGTEFFITSEGGSSVRI